MKNLTAKQNEIISNLVTEFARINEKTKISSDNIFAGFCEDVANDKARIEELKSLGVANEMAVYEQMYKDFDKYGKMLKEIGLELYELGFDERVFRIQTADGMYLNDRDGRTELQFEYIFTHKCECIFDEKITYVDGYYINMNMNTASWSFGDIEAMFADGSVKRYIKKLIAQK
jgi:hypothetical protein